MTLPPDTILAAGPVIIEGGKVLLNREKKERGSALFMFPGGVWKKSDLTLENTCRREVKEELGIDIEIIKPLRSLVVRRPENQTRYAVLIHYLAKRIGEVKPGPETIEWNWHPLDNLPKNCASNVFEIISDYVQDGML